ncbi:hypothetical protein [Barnesiella intestinihominis]|uniref:hypothetical protein n=1 Tax=Barnesiella intestinihominis TaxID=487174 RepID=UPI002673ED3A|nr:hypothetical protein [Barnesiella intestinihominis]
MERKVGEIFEYNGEWYQCMEGTGCYRCAFYDKNICIADNPHCTCRSDKKNVIFKKLEKVGDPYVVYALTRQKYKLHVPLVITDEILDEYISCDEVNGIVDIRAKQNKEDMKEKKLNLKPFDLEAAKAGKPVCTRDGRKARIICFDRKFLFNGVSYPIIALIENTDKEEIIYGYNEEGKVIIEHDTPYKDDLMMLPEKKEGWIIIHKEAIYDKETAEKIAKETTADVIRIQKIEWEE